jgi:hypothetical protein
MNVIEVFKNMNGIRRGDLHWEHVLNPGLVKSNIRSHFLGAGSFKHRLVEGPIGIIFGGPDEYAAMTAPLVVSPDIEQFSGAMFNKRGDVIRSSPAMEDAQHVRRFMDASERLARKALENG